MTCCQNHSFELFYLFLDINFRNQNKKIKFSNLIRIYIYNLILINQELFNLIFLLIKIKKVTYLKNISKMIKIIPSTTKDILT